MNKIKKLVMILGLPIFILAQTALAAASGPILPTGPQEPTGIQIQSGPILPTGVSESNSTTGEESVNQTSDNSESSVNVDINNDSEINNNNSTNLNTGNNEIGSNTIVGNITTGDICTAQTYLNVANSQFAPESSIGTQTIDASNINSLTLTPSNQRLEFVNDLTGPGSENLNEYSSENNIEISADNNSTQNNEIEINANTGNNEISNNTKTGDITTGDIELGINLINLANLYLPNLLLNADIWNLVGDFNGDIILDAENNLTGPDSNNSNKTNIEKNFNADITQNADINNILNLSTNTGNNEYGHNSVLGDIETGDTTVKANIYNLANITSIPIFYIFNLYGSWDGSLFGIDPSKVFFNQINDTTGSGSTNTNSTSVKQNTNIKIDNNAVTNNRIHLNADTGNNTINDNTVVGDIETGGIKIGVNLINILNSFSEEVGEFALRIINIFGDWNGNAIACGKCEKPKKPEKVKPIPEIPKVPEVPEEVKPIAEEEIPEEVEGIAQEEELAFLPETGQAYSEKTPTNTQTESLPLWLTLSILAFSLSSVITKVALQKNK